MSTFTGTLSIISHQSSLGTNLLMKAGIPDPTQAIFAATQFLVKIRRLQSGQFIKVIGNQIPNANIIIMQDAQPASPRQLGKAITELVFDADLAESELIRAFTESDSASATTKRKTNRKTESKEKDSKSSRKKAEK